MRVFAALPMPGHVLDAVGEWMEPLRQRYPHLKWVSRDRLHITLRFLGDVGEDAVDRLERTVEECSPGEIGFRLDEVGRFRRGRRGPATVLWLGGRFDPAVEELARLMGRIPDDRGRGARPGPFIPHLTVARKRRRGGPIPEDLPPFGPVEGSAGRVEIVNSRLTPRGPEYTVLRSCVL
jgi:2'-5' RNA ligase